MRSSESDRVIKLARLRLADEEPMTIQTAYLPDNLCHEIYEKQLDWTSQSLNLALRDLGFEVVAAVQRISSDVADSVEAELLQIPAGSPLLVGEQVSYLTDNRPIESLKSVYRGDRYDIVVNLTREMGKRG